MAATNAHVDQSQEGVSAASREIWFGWVLALLGTLAFSTATPVAKAALNLGMDSNGLLMGRSVIAVALMAITIGMTNPKRLRLPRRGVAYSLAAGGCAGSGMVVYFLGLRHLHSSMAAMLLSLSPLVVLTLLALRGERLTYRHGIRLALALVGAYLLIGPSGGVNLSGVGLVSLSLIFFALQVVVMQWYLISYDSQAVTFYILIGTTTAVFIWWAFNGMPWQPPGPRGWALMILLAVVGTFLARFLQFESVTRIGGSQTSLLTPLQTLFAVVWSFIFLGDRLTVVQLVGAGLILASAILAIRRLKRGNRRQLWRIWART